MQKSILKSFTKCVLVAVLILIVGLCSLNFDPPLPSDVETALWSPEKVVLFSIDSGNSQLWAAWERKQPQIYGFAKLGHTELKGSDAYFAVSSLWWRLKWYDSPYSLTKVGFGCFWPHHIIQVTSAGHVYDFLVCYDCGAAQVYKDGKYGYQFGWSGDKSEWNSVFIRDKVRLPEMGVPDEIQALTPTPGPPKPL